MKEYNHFKNFEDFLKSDVYITEEVFDYLEKSEYRDFWDEILFEYKEDNIFKPIPVKLEVGNTCNLALSLYAFLIDIVDKGHRLVDFFSRDTLQEVLDLKKYIAYIKEVSPNTLLKEFGNLDTDEEIKALYETADLYEVIAEYEKLKFMYEMYKELFEE